MAQDGEFVQRQKEQSDASEEQRQKNRADRVQDEMALIHRVELHHDHCVAERNDREYPNDDVHSRERHLCALGVEPIIIKKMTRRHKKDECPDHGTHGNDDI